MRPLELDRDSMGDKKLLRTILKQSTSKPNKTARKRSQEGWSHQTNQSNGFRDFANQKQIFASIESSLKIIAQL